MAHMPLCKQKFGAKQAKLSPRGAIAVHSHDASIGQFEHPTYAAGVPPWLLDDKRKRGLDVVCQLGFVHPKMG